MNKLSSSSEYCYIPVTGPSGTDLTVFPVSIALRLEATGGEPATGDYVASTWVNGEAAVNLATGVYPDGQYLAFVRIQPGVPQDIRLLAGRVRIGDVRV
jgi:hypothetical protein